MLDLTQEEREAARAIYRDIIGALNKHKASTVVAFSAIGAALYQAVSEDGVDATNKHRLVNEFAKSTHDLIDEKG